MATYLSLCDALLKETGVYSQGLNSVNDQQGMPLKAVRWVNRAWTNLQNQKNWSFLWVSGAFTTVEGQSIYDPVANLALSPKLQTWIANSIHIDDGSVIGALGYRDYGDWPIQQSSAIGKPSVFTIRPDKALAFDVAPDAAYEIPFEYYRAPQQLITNTDAPIMDEQFHDAILYQAMIYLAAEQDAGEIYQDAAQQLTIITKQMDDAYLPRVTFANRPIA